MSKSPEQSDAYREGALVVLPTGCSLPVAHCWRCGGTDRLSTVHLKLQHPRRRRSGPTAYVFIANLGIPWVHLDVPLCHAHRSHRSFLLALGPTLFLLGNILIPISLEFFDSLLLLGLALTVMVSGVVPLYFYTNLATVRAVRPDEVSSLLGDASGPGTAMIAGAGLSYLNQLAPPGE